MKAARRHLWQTLHVPKPLKPAPDPEAPKPPSHSFMCLYRPSLPMGLSDRAAAGDAESQFELGRLYFEGTADRSGPFDFTPGVPRDYVEAEHLLNRAAEQGHEGARQLLEVLKLHSPRGVH